MQMMFVDESGTPQKQGEAYPRYFVVGGIIIPETAWHKLRDNLLGMKILRKIRGEIKWRYFAPANDDVRNPMRGIDQATRDAIRTEIYAMICAEKSIKSIVAICSPTAAYSMPSVTTQDDIYHLTYKTVTERFQYFLQDVTKETGVRNHGIIVCDHRETRDDKRLRTHHQMLLHSSAEFVSNYRNLVESLFLQPSNMSIGIQLADMVAGAVWRKFERNDDRWYRHIELSLRRSKNGVLAGYGLIKVPKTNWV